MYLQVLSQLILCCNNNNPFNNLKLYVNEILSILWHCITNIYIAGSGQGQIAGTCECGNEPSVSTKCREFMD